MVKIRRFKHINEDDLQTVAQPAAQPQQNTAAQQPATTTATPQPVNTQQPALQQNALQPAAQPTQLQNTNQLQQAQQDNNQQLNTQLQTPNYQEKVKMLLDNNHMANTYWIMSVDLPAEIQKEIPDFKKGNALADLAIKMWELFKAQPNELTFNNFVTAFSQFGQVNTALDANQQQQTVLLNNTATPQNNVNAGLQVSYNFKLKLMENLLNASKKKYYNEVLTNYFGD